MFGVIDAVVGIPSRPTRPPVTATARMDIRVRVRLSGDGLNGTFV
jgi:hypothetical protein